MEEFAAQRAELHRLLQEAVGLPGLLKDWQFEFAPAAAVGAEEAYLANVRDCDVFVVIFGGQARPAVVRECEEALATGRQILAFAQRVAAGGALPSDVAGVLPRLKVKYGLYDDAAEVVGLVAEALGHHIAERARASDVAASAVSREPAAAASLRILCVVPSALRGPDGDDVAQLDYMREWEDLCRATRGLPVCLELLWPATLGRLENALAGASQAGAPYGVVHISCHGAPGALLFDDGYGEGVTIAAADVAGALRATPPALLVVSACLSDAGDETAPSVAAAAVLRSRGRDVVGIQAPG